MMSRFGGDATPRFAFPHSNAPDIYFDVARRQQLQSGLIDEKNTDNACFSRTCRKHASFADVDITLLSYRTTP